MATATTNTSATSTNRAVVTTPAERDIRIERVFNAPRERVWKAMSDPALIVQWWGRGNKMVIERDEQVRGGHWRYVESSAKDGVNGFEGRYREVIPGERVVRTFEWDGMPGHVIIETMTLEDLGDGRTKLVSTMLFHSTIERDGMLGAGMEGGMNESYVALDGLLARMK